MRTMLFVGSLGESLVERTDDGMYVVTTRVNFDDGDEARRFALERAHKPLSRATLEGWEFDAVKLREVEEQIADARAAKDDLLEAALRRALLDAGMREIAAGHPQARDVARAVVHLVDSEPDVIGAKVIDLRSRMVG